MKPYLSVDLSGYLWRSRKLHKFR